ncbi:MAG: peptidoglycan DD-metalloendopeptidase family protein [Pseudomonadota bacterium]
MTIARQSRWGTSFMVAAALLPACALVTGCGAAANAPTAPPAQIVVVETPAPTSTPTSVPTTAPTAPAAFLAVARDSAAALSWDASPGAATYAVSRSTSSGGPYTTIASGLASTTYTDGGLANGTIYFYVVSASNVAGVSPNATQARVTPVSTAASGSVRWPLSSSASADADGVRYPYAPRRIDGSYDFHAGVDIPAPKGTPVHAIMDGVVTGITLDDGSTGPGNRVLVNHGDQKWVGYLHLDAFAAGIIVGKRVTAGTLLGYVGKTGATNYHLHLTYMVGLPSETTSESRSKNPLEILPHSAPPGLTAVFAGDNSVEVSLPAHRMTVRWIVLKGGGQTRLVDYYEVVSKGSANRNGQSQSGVYIDATAPPEPDPAARLSFKLVVRPDPANAFTVDRIILKDFNGSTLLDQVR